MKGLLFLLSLLALMACSSETNQASDSSEKASSSKVNTVDKTPYMAYLADDSLHLIRGVFPNLQVDSHTIPDSTTNVEMFEKRNGFERSLHYQIQDGQLMGAQLYIRHYADQEKLMKAISDHLNRFNGQHFPSHSFHNWLIDFESRPLTEINVFPQDSLIEINLHRRQHI